MAVDVGKELGGVERAFKLIGLQFRKIDAVRREPSERFVERGGNIPYTEYEGRDHRLTFALGRFRNRGHYEKARHIVIRFPHIRLPDNKPGYFGGALCFPPRPGRLPGPGK